MSLVSWMVFAVILPELLIINSLNFVLAFVFLRQRIQLTS